jgi:hypothetical protein
VFFFESGVPISLAFTVAPVFPSFLSFLAFAFVVVDNTAVVIFYFFLSLSILMNSGYLYVLGLALEIHLKFFGTFKFLLRPIKAVGVNARDKKFIIGYQYQCCMKSITPTIAF